MLGHKKILFVILLFISFPFFGNDVSSIKKNGSAIKPLSKQIAYYTQMAHKYSYSNPNLALEILDEIEEISIRSGKSKYIMSAYLLKAEQYWSQSRVSKAEDYYFKHYRFADSVKDKKQLAKALFNIGWVEVVTNKDFAQLPKLEKSLKLYGELRDTVGMINLYNSLGSAYSVEFDKDIIQNKKYYEQSLAYYNKGIMLSIRSNNIERRAAIYANLGLLYKMSKESEKAIGALALAIHENYRSNDSLSLIVNITARGEILNQQNKSKEALLSLDLAQKISDLTSIRMVDKELAIGYAETYEKLGDYATALRYYKKFLQLEKNDLNRSKSGKLQEMADAYSLTQSQVQIANQKKALELQSLKNKLNILAIILLLLFAFFMVRYSTRQSKIRKSKEAANQLLTEQNVIITKKKAEIEESILYARGLQQSIMPPKINLQRAFPDSFIIFQPKDVVSGDFYWMHEVGDYFYCVVADCTGHGVPGAFMSVIGVDKLAQSVFEKAISSPGKILEFLNVEFIAALKQGMDTKHRDGMDLSLVRFDKKKKELVFAGANRPLIICNNGILKEYKSDKVAIGGYTPLDYVFSEQIIRIEKNDSVYMFSDGYPDQFGGKYGKKFMSKKLKERYLELHKLPMDKQGEALLNDFDDWKGDEFQVDDVLMIGIRFN